MLPWRVENVKGTKVAPLNLKRKGREDAVMALQKRSTQSVAREIEDLVKLTHLKY